MRQVCDKAKWLVPALVVALATSGAQAETASHEAPGVAAADADQGAQVAAKETGAEAEKPSRGKSLWGYAGKKGPANWGRLSGEFQACLAGVGQSPVNIGGSGGFDGASVAEISFNYTLSPVEFTNNGHTVQVNYAPGSSMTVAGKRYELLQFHFHTPSEHAVKGQRAAAEAHLVHKSADGELAVVGILMEEGADNLALSEFWGFMPRKAGETKRDKKVLINARDLLPSDTGYYRYMGSLTTPPCSEGVNWYVMAEPVSIGARQVQQFEVTIGANARPLQPVNKRLVLAPLDPR